MKALLGLIIDYTNGPKIFIPWGEGVFSIQQRVIQMHWPSTLTMNIEKHEDTCPS